MASPSKHLKELLKEDQEPFVLKTHIDDKLSTARLQLKKRKPTSFSRSICRNACFLTSSTSSPDVKKSPLFDLRSPVKSPCRNSNSNSNTLFVHIPARTAALLLEAALRIQKNSALKKTKSLSPRKNIGFGLFGSIFKRLTSRKRHQKNESDMVGERVSVRDIIRWDSVNSSDFFTPERQKKEELVMGFEDKMGLSCSCTSTLSSSVWSESNEEKSFDLETSSSRSEDSVDMEKGFCSSPFSFVLHDNALSPCRQSPKSMPSSINRKAVDNANRGTSTTDVGCEEEDKEQNSPVSVLDPPFEDDDDDDHEDDETEDCFELLDNFTNVQRAKQQLMHKLRRFERVAGLDPVELEKRIAEQEDEERFDDTDYDSDLSDSENRDSMFVRELLTQSNMYNHQIIPSDMKRLVLDLVDEEVRLCSREFVAEKVCRRLEAWKEVEFNTIDMMVEFDFRRDANEWAKNPEQMQETTADIELAIFGFLVEELAGELVQSNNP